MDNNSKIEQIKLLKDKIPDKALRKEIQRVFRVKKTQGNDIFRKLFSGFASATCKNKTDGEEKEVNTSSSSNDLEAVLKECNVDKNLWEVEHYSVNKENKAVKVAGETKYEAVFNFRIRLKKKKVNLEELLEEFIESTKEYSPKYPKYKSPNDEKDGLYILNLHDFHFASLVSKKETFLADYDIKIAKKLYLDAVKDLMEKAPRHKIQKVVIIAGSDYFNSDNDSGTTFGGTKLDNTDSRMSKVFTEGCNLLVTVIDQLISDFEVHVVTLSGNHDKTISQYLGAYLSAWYRNCKNVTVDNAPTSRKYLEHYKVLIGFDHGDSTPLKNLPLVLINERPDAGMFKHRTFLTGHLHQDTCKEIAGISIRIAPSLSANTKWASEMGLIGNVRVGQGLLYDKDSLSAIYYSKPVE